MARVIPQCGIGRGFESHLPLLNSADVAQLVEHILGKDEVTGSIPVVSSSNVKELIIETWPSGQDIILRMEFIESKVSKASKFKTT